MCVCVCVSNQSSLNMCHCANLELVEAKAVWVTGCELPLVMEADPRLKNQSMIGGSDEQVNDVTVPPG